MKLATLLLLAAPLASAQPIAVLDIARADADQVAQLKRDAGDGWWLEMGDQLVVAGERAIAARPLASTRLLATHAVGAGERLLLRARGCSEHSVEAGSVVARGGRWELRRVPVEQSAALLEDAHGAWQAVTPNTSLAQRFRRAPHGQPSAPDPAVQAIVDRVDATRWFGDVATLAAWDRSSYATTSLQDARDWIAGQFDALGLDTAIEPFSMNASGGGTITRHNVAGAWIGSSQPERWVIVGAHYDSRTMPLSATAGTPGAEDNASGCAGVIELARALLPSKPSRSILFVCYAGEEQGLRGSIAQVQSMNANELASIDAVVIMDMIGYSADANLEALYESSNAWTDYLALFGEAAATYVPGLAVVTSTNPFGSDHVPYLNAGLRTVLAIENDWDIYPHYHKSTDTTANMGPNATAMGGAILATNAAVLADLAGLPDPPSTWPGFADGFEDAP